MASPDHAATVRDALGRLMVPDYEAMAALDALVAALAQAEHERDQAIEALREIGTPTSTGSRTIQSIRRYARDVLANIEKDTA